MIYKFNDSRPTAFIRFVFKTPEGSRLITDNLELLDFETYFYRALKKEGFQRILFLSPDFIKGEQVYTSKIFDYLSSDYEDMETTSKFIDNDLSQKLFGKNILNKILFSNDLDIEMEENISNFLDHQDPSVIVIDLEFLNFYNDPHLELSNTNNILNSLIQKGLENVNSKVIFLLSSQSR